MFAFAPGVLIDPDPGSNWPRLSSCPGWAAELARFLAFCPAFAFARWRARALVMIRSPFRAAEFLVYEEYRPILGLSLNVLTMAVNPGNLVQ